MWSGEREGPAHTCQTPGPELSSLTVSLRMTRSESEPSSEGNYSLELESQQLREEMHLMKHSRMCENPQGTQRLQELKTGPTTSRSVRLPGQVPADPAA